MNSIVSDKGNVGGSMKSDPCSIDNSDRFPEVDSFIGHMPRFCLKNKSSFQYGNIDECEDK